MQDALLWDVGAKILVFVGEGVSMQRVFVVCLSVLLCGMLIACDSSDGTPRQKIGVVNINRILVDSEPGKAAAKYMEGLQDSLREQATELQKKFQGMSEKDADDEAKQKDVQMEYIRLQSKMQAEQQNVNNILNDVVHRVVEKYRVTNGYSIIIFSDVALSFEQSVDVTSGITMAMNAEKVEFKPLPEPKTEGTTDEVKEPSNTDATVKTDGQGAEKNAKPAVQPEEGNTAKDANTAVKTDDQAKAPQNTAEEKDATTAVEQQKAPEAAAEDKK